MFLCCDDDRTRVKRAWLRDMQKKHRYFSILRKTTLLTSLLFFLLLTLSLMSQSNFQLDSFVHPTTTTTHNVPHKENEFMKFNLSADTDLSLLFCSLSGFWCLKILLKHERVFVVRKEGLKGILVYHKNVSKFLYVRFIHLNSALECLHHPHCTCSLFKFHIA